MQSGGIGGQIANQYRGRRAGDAHHIVVFGQPVAVIAALFSQLGEIERMGEGFSRGEPWGSAPDPAPRTATVLSVIKAHFATASSSD
jgi:hypothetical protein